MVGQGADKNKEINTLIKHYYFRHVQVKIEI